MAYTTINKSSSFMNTKLYTGTGSSHSVTGVGFQPDIVWTKQRSGTENHGIYDAVRGTTRLLHPNINNLGYANANSLTAFGSDGFTVGSEGTSNANGSTYVSWNWKANGSGSANTDGSINSTVSANTTSRISIVTYTGTGSNATVGHGLGVVPTMIIVKEKSGSVNDWVVYHHKNTSAPETDALILNEENATDDGAGYWNDTAPTSSVFSVGTGSVANRSSSTYVAYCFSDVTGFSKYGGFTGNGSATAGVFVYTGFRPTFFLVKNTGSEKWVIIDDKRNTYNGGNGIGLKPNANNADETTSVFNVDFLSNGFKMYSSWNGFNDSGDTYIYMAFGQTIVGSNNIPATAR